jgi:predicted HTH transcriptional regulator
VRRWTGASERAVKNWLAGTTGPSGDHLLHILRYSDTALEMILAASRRVQVLELLFGTAEMHIDVLPIRPTFQGDRVLPKDGASLSHGTDPDRDPNHDPDDDPIPTFEPNERQLWFLSELAAGHRVTARSMEGQFSVSEKTAKRDIAALKTQGILHFVGSRRRGRYHLTRGKA